MTIAMIRRFRAPVLVGLTIVLFGGLLAIGQKNGKSGGTGGSGTFKTTGSMNFPRFNHRAVLLNTGQVLVVGGVVGNVNENVAELYNPATGKWVVTGGTAILHEQGTLTLLPNGQALLVGGFDVHSVCTAVAELYNPSTGQWTPTGSMNEARCQAKATVLSNGQVLVAGGISTNGSALDTAELYNPSTGTWQVTGSLNTSASVTGSAERLANGSVLVVVSDFTAELFQPLQGRWAQTGSLADSQHGGPMSLLANGDVLVVSNSFYNPTTGRWTATGPLPLLNLGSATTATLLGTGEVLTTGWSSIYDGSHPISTAILYDFSTNSYAITGSMNTARVLNTATLLQNGQVLVAGGYNKSSGITPLSSAELYTP